MIEELRFDARVVAVTGAGRGIGRGHAMLLAQRGAQVVVADLGAEFDGTSASSGPAEAVVREIEAHGGEAVACYASVAEDDGAASVVETAVSAFGRIDAVISNAGINDPDSGRGSPIPLARQLPAGSSVYPGVSACGP